MAKSFSTLTKGFSKARKTRIEKETRLLKMEYDLLSELRKDQDITQQELSEILEIRQSAISKLESQDDVMVKTLEKYIQALGGELEVRAKFPGKTVTLKQFSHSLA
jgi:transcriptional regulator with XRE-family HTH domain